MAEQEQQIGVIFRRKVDKSYQYVQAQRMLGETGFTVKQEASKVDGVLHPGVVTGGGPGDYVCLDLKTQRKFAVHQSVFDLEFERVSARELPKEVRESLFGEIEPGVQTPNPEP